MTLPVETFGSGAPLVALHGFLGRGSDWAGVAAWMPDVRIVAPDLPGHGAALHLPDESFSMAGAAALVLQMMDAQGIEKSALLGYSMGGRLALYLALHAPERFTRLVLESASPGLRTDAERAERRRLDATRTEEIERDLPGFLERWYAMPLFAATPPEWRARLARERAAGDPAGLARSLLRMGTGAQPSLWEKLPALAVPTLALAGSRDAKFVGLAGEMAAEADRMRVHVVPEAGHTVHLDAPEAFVQAVRDFLTP